MTHPTDDEIMSLAGSWFHTGENQKRDDGYYYRSLGTPSNVRGSDLIEFARALLAEQAQEPKAEDAPSEAELLADTPTPKPQEGLWTLTAPDGRTYQADSPLRCCGLEQRERVPADVAMARIFRSASEPDDSELLDWLDATNKRFKMGWKVGVAPAGNCSVQSVIFLGNSEPVTIRAAIRAALLATPPKD